MKKIIAVLLSVIMLLFSVFPAFALTQEELESQIKEFQDYVTYCESAYIYYWYEQPPSGPFWSQAASDRMTEAIAVARSTEITTQDELEKARVDFEQVVATMTLDPEELEFMIYLFEKETNENGYYDELTWSKFQSVLAEGKRALETGDEEVMYCAYIDMRNEFDDLCIYNTEYGDFDGDGVLSVKDVTMAQKYLANLIEFNSSQELMSRFNFGFLDVNKVTNLQKYIVGSAEKMSNYEMNKLMNFEGFDVNNREFGVATQNVNPIYYREYSIYFDNCHP